MSESVKDLARMVITLTAGELEKVVECAVDKALAKKKPARLLFTVQEAADMLGLPDSWLAAKSRAGEVAHRRTGHYIRFSLQDIESIINQFAIVPVPMVYSSYDGQGVQEDSSRTGEEPGRDGQDAGRHRNGSGALGTLGAVNIGAGGAGDETTPAQIQTGEALNGSTEKQGGYVRGEVSRPRRAKAKDVSQLPRGAQFRRKDQDPVT